MSNKCPQCGLPEHESGACPYARPKGEKYDYVEAVLIPVAEPSLSLLVVDFGDGCIIKCEQGDFNQIDAAALLVTGSTCMDNVAITSYSFLELQKSIDAHFAEDKPLPRLEYSHTSGERDDEYVMYTFHGSNNRDGYLLDADLAVINELARQAGATRDLPIYEPKGKWVQLCPVPPHIGHYPEHSESAYIATLNFIKEFNEKMPVMIWRYER